MPLHANPPHADTAAVLITMPHSHYAEKARWALDRLAVPYREEPHVPLFHLLTTRRRGGRSVPILLQDGERFVDSTDILQRVDAHVGGDHLYPRDPDLRRAVDTLEERFDEGLGPHTRRWAYFQLLPHRDMLHPLMARGVPAIESRLLHVALPVVVLAIRKALRVTPDGAQRSLLKVRDLFAEVDDLLADGRPFLVDGRFTAADLTFAALAAPVLLPERGIPAYPAVAQLPPVMREEVERLRDTRAGRFGLRLYAEERWGGRRTA
jgi:glutathione S-transferase